MRMACHGCEMHYGIVDEVELRVQVVDGAEQQKSADKSKIGFPLEPVQLFRHSRRSHQILFVVVKTAAMDGPEFATYSGGFIFVARGRAESQVQPDEIKRCADPHDADHHVEPAQSQADPGGEVYGHLLSRCRDTRACWE